MEVDSHSDPESRSQRACRRICMDIYGSYAVETAEALEAIYDSLQSEYPPPVFGCADALTLLLVLRAELEEDKPVPNKELYQKFLFESKLLPGRPELGWTKPGNQMLQELKAMCPPPCNRTATICSAYASYCRAMLVLNCLLCEGDGTLQSGVPDDEVTDEQVACDHWLLDTVFKMKDIDKDGSRTAFGNWVTWRIAPFEAKVNSKRGSAFMTETSNARASVAKKIIPELDRRLRVSPEDQPDHPIFKEDHFFMESWKMFVFLRHLENVHQSDCAVDELVVPWSDSGTYGWWQRLYPFGRQFGHREMNPQLIEWSEYWLVFRKNHPLVVTDKASVAITTLCKYMDKVPLLHSLIGVFPVPGVLGECAPAPWISFMELKRDDTEPAGTVDLFQMDNYDTEEEQDEADEDQTEKGQEAEQIAPAKRPAELEDYDPGDESDASLTTRTKRLSLQLPRGTERTSSQRGFFLDSIRGSL